MVSRVCLLAMLAVVAGVDRDELRSPAARGRDRDVRRAPRPPALSEPDVRRLLGRARERRANSVPRRSAETALLRRASVRRQARTCSGTSRRSGSFAAQSERGPTSSASCSSPPCTTPRGRQRSAAASTASSTTASAVSGRRASRPAVSQVNGSTRTTVSDVDLAASGANPVELLRAQSHVATKTGLYARGRFAATPNGGRVFRALRLYLRVA